MKSANRWVDLPVVGIDVDERRPRAEVSHGIRRRDERRAITTSSSRSTPATSSAR
jgi:hypothetical protein